MKTGLPCRGALQKTLMDGKEDHRQPLASGLTWAALVPPTPDAQGRAGPSAQTSTAKGRPASHHEATRLAGCSWVSPS